MDDTLRLDASLVDYALVVVYFAVVLLIGFAARRRVSDSLDFFLSGRSLPAWVTGLAFISANLGAVEIVGMSANGAQFGMATMHYFWIGAVPAMLFLGIVMMPFYYGSKVRSVPEFMRRRFGTGAHLVNAISFAVAQVLIAGINLYLLAHIVEAAAGLAALGVADHRRGRRAQLHHPGRAVGGHLQRGPAVLRHRRRAGAADADRAAPGRRRRRADRQGHEPPATRTMLSSWPATEPDRLREPVLVGRRASSSASGSCCPSATGRRTSSRCSGPWRRTPSRRRAATPIIGSFPKMFVPFIVVIPGIIATVLVPEVVEAKAVRRTRTSTTTTRSCT